MHNRPARAYLNKKGYTLIEIIISMTLLSLLIGGILSFYLQFFSAGWVNEQRNLINRDIRNLTARLTQDGRQANYFKLYKSHEAGDRNDAADDQLLDGKSGDFLVFVYTEPATQLYHPNSIRRIVGYYRDVPSGQPDARGPVRRFDLSYNPASSQTLEDLLPSSSQLSLSPTVIELSEGMSDGRLFYNFQERSVMVNGQIYHGNDAKRVTETYNFTISPRG